MELLPEHVGCPQCGSTDGKRWRSYSGVELCTDCEWDFLSTLNERKLLDAQQTVMTRRPGVGRSVALAGGANENEREMETNTQGTIRGTRRKVRTLWNNTRGTDSHRPPLHESPTGSSQEGRASVPGTSLGQGQSRNSMPEMPRESRSNSRKMASRWPSTARPKDNWRCKWKPTLDKLVTPGYNSLCLLCGRIFYGAAMSSCSRCGGLCQQVSDHDLGLMGRNAKDLAEAQ